MTLQAFALSAQLDALARHGLRRQLHPVSAGVTPVTVRGGQRLVNFASNDYLGLASHPALREAILSHLADHGVGSGAAHLVCGHTSVHEQLEQQLAIEAGYPRALLFSSGFAANLGVQDALLSRGDVVYQDKLNHASLLDGARLSGARLRRYPHLNTRVLAQWLAQDREDLPSARQLMATDQVFSMDGDEAPLPALRRLADTHQAALLVDDAHGFGLRDAPLPPVDVYMATLGKALGTYGAFVSGAEELIEFLANKARPFVYSTAAPPLLAAAALAALHLSRAEAWRRTHLRDLIGQFRQAVLAQGWALLPSHTPIQPILVGDTARTLWLSEQLAQRGFLVVAIRPPTVPPNTARLRITLSAAHSPDQVQGLVAALGALR